MKDLIVHEEAHGEVLDEAIYYEQRCVGLGLDFVAEVERVYERILEAPERWQKAKYGTRRLTLFRFPHTVFYRVFPDTIWIVAVAPQRRRPFYWQRRLQGRPN